MVWFLGHARIARLATMNNLQISNNVSLDRVAKTITCVPRYDMFPRVPMQPFQERRSERAEVVMGWKVHLIPPTYIFSPRLL
jgi:hypothetical protein